MTHDYGSEAAKVPLVDKEGELAGEVHLLLEWQETEKVPPQSAAGSMLGNLYGARPQGGAVVSPVSHIPVVEGTPTSPATGALAPGELDNPSSPTYGILSYK